MAYFKTRKEEQKDTEIESALQAIETLLDSSSQRLSFLHGKNNPEEATVGVAQV